MRCEILAFFALVLLLLPTVGSTALACDCLTLGPTASFEEADVVFEGELIRSTELTRSTELGFEVAYTFQVNKVLKGEARNEFTLVQWRSDCDPDFFANIVYRVYARRSEAKLFSTTCFANEALRVRKINNRAGFTFPSLTLQTKALAIAAICVLTTLIVRFLVRGLRLKRN